MLLAGIERATGQCAPGIHHILTYMSYDGHVLLSSASSTQYYQPKALKAVSIERNGSNHTLHDTFEMCVREGKPQG